MYIPKPFEISDSKKVIDFIEKNAFGQLISFVNGRISSTHLPVLLSDDKCTLFAHLAGVNPQCEELDGQEVLITLEGPHGYISPSWYESPGVPTWNYQAVHIYGRAKVFNEPERLKATVDALTKKYEKTFETPWKPNYKAAMLNAIIGVEVEISDIQCKFKLSQNRSENDRKAVIDNLTAFGSVSLANAMKDNA